MPAVHPYFDASAARHCSHFARKFTVAPPPSRGNGPDPPSDADVDERKGRYWPRAVRIRLQEPLLLDELIDALRNIGCTCEREGDDAFVVNYPIAADERERQLELNFFVRAWALRHGGVESVLASSEASVQA